MPPLLGLLKSTLGQSIHQATSLHRQLLVPGRQWRLTVESATVAPVQVPGLDLLHCLNLSKPLLDSAPPFLRVDWGSNSTRVVRMKCSTQDASVPCWAHTERSVSAGCVVHFSQMPFDLSLTLDPSALLCWGHQELLMAKGRSWPRSQQQSNPEQEAGQESRGELGRESFYHLGAPPATHHLSPHCSMELG